MITLILNLQGFDELLELATKGHHQNVDMLVRLSVNCLEKLFFKTSSHFEILGKNRLK